jgi:hypothetical protein
MSREAMKQEPMAWQCQCGKAYTVTCISSKPAKQWQGLTDVEIEEIQKSLGIAIHWSDFRAIEAKLREKNHG